jgi:excisionase family DNA binding protein
MPNDEFYTPEEIATVLKVSRQAIYKWINEGRIKAIRVGTDWRIPAAVYEQLVNEGVPQKDDGDKIVAVVSMTLS